MQTEIEKEFNFNYVWMILMILYCSLQALDCINKNYTDLAVGFASIAGICLGIIIQKISNYL